MRHFTSIAMMAFSIGFLTAFQPVLSAESVQSVADAAATRVEDSPIRPQLAEVGKCLAKGDMDGLVSMWTKDGTYTDDSGKTFKGREQLRARFETATDSGVPPAVRLAPDSIRTLSDNVVEAEGTVLRDITGGESIPETRYSMVFTKQDGKWLIASATETPIIQPEIIGKVDHLKDLSWLIGDWKAERNGSTLHLHADWAGNNNFIRCRYEISKPGQKAQDDAEIIGFDPRDGQMVSWNFDSTGAFGQSVWQKDGSKWQIDSSKTSREGVTLTAHNIITIQNPNTFSWQSIDRTDGGMPVGDTGELQVTRIAK